MRSWRSPVSTDLTVLRAGVESFDSAGGLSFFSGCGDQAEAFSNETWRFDTGRDFVKVSASKRALEVKAEVKLEVKLEVQMKRHKEVPKRLGKKPSIKIRSLRFLLARV